MRTTLDIDEKILDDVVRVTGLKTKSKAVSKALEEYIRGMACDNLLAMEGTMQFDENWDIWRRTDLGMLRKFEIDDTNPADLVLVDSNLWIDFLSVPDSRDRSELHGLMRRRLAATTGIVSAEVLYGASSNEQFERLARLMNRIHFLDTTQVVWTTVTGLAFHLKQTGEPLPLPDLIIAAVTIEHGCRLFTRDQGFQRIPELRMFVPGAGMP